MARKEFDKVISEVEEFIALMTYQRDRWDLRKN